MANLKKPVIPWQRVLQRDALCGGGAQPDPKASVGVVDRHLVIPPPRTAAIAQA